MKSEIEFSNAIIQDREQGIKEIEKALTEVNEIFIDLSNLVVEQGAMIGTLLLVLVYSSLQTILNLMWKQRMTIHREAMKK
jgi:t-SNARE complex subunit (syntaxin)